MSATWMQILELIRAGAVKISEHGYDELSADGISAREILAGVEQGRVVEEYPDYPKGPCVLVLQNDREDKPLHAVWGIPRGRTSPAVLITAYRPEPDRWLDGFTRRIR